MPIKHGFNTIKNFFFLHHLSTTPLVLLHIRSPPILLPLIFVVGHDVPEAVIVPVVAVLLISSARFVSSMATLLICAIFVQTPILSLTYLWFFMILQHSSPYILLLPSTLHLLPLLLLVLLHPHS